MDTEDFYVPLTGRTAFDAGEEMPRASHVVARLPASRLLSMAMWRGTLLPSILPRLLMMSAYVSLVYVLLAVNPETHKALLSVHGTQMKTLFTMWGLSTSILLVPFVSGATKKWQALLDSLRRFQGRLNDIMLLTSAYTKNTPGGAKSGAAIARLVKAVSHASFAGFKAVPRELAVLSLGHAKAALTADENEALEALPQPGYGLLVWVLAAATQAAERRHVRSPQNYAFHMSNQVMQVRSAIGVVSDLLDDTHGPLLFTHLMTLNLTFSFILLPWALAEDMGPWVIPGAFFYVLLYDGLLTYASMASQPFTGRYPLLNINTIIAESSRAVTKRFPPAAAHFPRSLMVDS